MSEVSKLLATDETFREVADLLFGGGADYLIAKANPDGADVASRKKRERTEARIGLATNVIGIGAGAAATPPAFREAAAARRRAKGQAPKEPKPPGKIKAKIGRVTGGKKTAYALAGGAAGLQVANLGGDFVANRVLARSAKDPNKVKKNIKEMPESGAFPKSKGQMTAAVAMKGSDKVVAANKGKFRLLPNKVETTRTREVKKARGPKVGTFRRLKADLGQTAANSNRASADAGRAARETARTMRTARNSMRAVGAAGVVGVGAGGYAAGNKGRKKYDAKVKKSADLDIRWEGEISKVNEDKQQVFGWASIVEVNGEPVVDLQGDYIAIDEVEKSAYEYVHKSRKGGDMHLRDEVTGDAKVGSHMIESFVITEDKKQALGMDPSTPTGWWVGYQVNDPDLWSKVKSGERTGFSIHGRGVRS